MTHTDFLAAQILIDENKIKVIMLIVMWLNIVSQLMIMLWAFCCDHHQGGSDHRSSQKRCCCCAARRPAGRFFFWNDFNFKVLHYRVNCFTNISNSATQTFWGAALHTRSNQYAKKVRSMHCWLLRYKGDRKRVRTTAKSVSAAPRSSKSFCTSSAASATSCTNIA